ncbi:DUF2029 domain-containing protein [Sphingomonas floccifaciens]|uniref:DUF2029 domain-containing protein n=1 Tax=Sphingomonas floccifaciens TaxID=1844115 RepID=A0ABW4N8K7_9SPHN
MFRLARPLPLLAALIATLVTLALLRPVDHDESQYVAATLLTAGEWLPYRDYAYLQTPLQPFAFAPIAWVSGWLVWPALRIINALLGALTVAAAWRAMRVAGVDPRVATAGAALFAASDILLFSAGTARNDALPAALLAMALVPMLRAERGEGSRGGAVLAGVLLGAAAAAKLSYALPAAVYGVYALVVRRHRPGWVALGALPAIMLVGWLAATSPVGFVFGVLTFPAAAPAEYYEAAGRGWKLTLGARVVDLVKFLALGPGLLAMAILLLPLLKGRGWVALRGADRLLKPTHPQPLPIQGGERRLLDLLILAGLVAAVLPSPVWRQYLLPMLVPLFVRLGIAWQARPPSRNWRIAAVVFACAGLAPSVEALAKGGNLGEGLAVARAIGPREGVATLSPQLLGRAPDARFATGPFYFRSSHLLDASQERALRLISQARLDGLAANPPRFILVGGEGRWSSGEDALDGVLERWAITNGYRLEQRIGTRFRLYARSRLSVVPPSILAR